MTGTPLFVELSEITGGSITDCEDDGSTSSAVAPDGDIFSFVLLLTAVMIKVYSKYWIKQLHEVNYRCEL